MTSMQSDTESNVSGLIRYSDKNCKQLYKSVIEKMEILNQDILEIEKNMKNIIKQSGPMENQLATLLLSLPKPDINFPMETE